MVLPEDFRHTLDEPLRMLRQHEIFPGGQGTPQAFEGFPTHHDDIAHRHLLEPLEIIRQMPWDLPIRADHAVLRHRGNGLEVFHSDLRRLRRLA